MTKQENNNPKIVNIFPINLYIDFIKNLPLEDYLSKVYNYIKEYPTSVAVSNQGGYQSNSEVHFHPYFSSLVKLLNEYNYKFTGNPNSKISSMWINISKYGNYNSLHVHTESTNPSTFQQSGVLYLKTPLNSGDIEFHNPSHISGFFNVTPQERMILIFPQFVPHFVAPNLSQEDRISIAFNYE